VSNLTKGGGYALKGFQFLKSNRSLWPYAVAPILINILFFLIAGYLGYHYGVDLYQKWVPSSDSWVFQALGWLMRVIIIMVVLVLTFFIFPLAGTVIGAPFNDLLSERVERLVQKEHMESMGFLKGLAGFFKSLWEALRLLGFKLLLTFITLPFMLLNFLVPFVGSIPAILVLIYFMAFDFLDLPLARHNFTLKEKRVILRRHRSLTMGFGLAVYFMMMIPLAQLLVLPVASVGATLLFIDAGFGRRESISEIVT